MTSHQPSLIPVPHPEDEYYRVALFIKEVRQYLFVQAKMKDGNPSFSTDRMNAHQCLDLHEARSFGEDLADCYETTYITEPWYETGR
jgi:hypothetical protein